MFQSASQMQRREEALALNSQTGVEGRRWAFRPYDACTCFRLGRADVSEHQG